MDEEVVLFIGGFLAPKHDAVQIYFPAAHELELLAQTVKRRRFRIVLARVSGVASTHDRACEIYAQLRGKRTDYGEEHARTHGHARFGFDYSTEGAHPAWSAAYPIHIFAHSFGGNTALRLQDMLAERKFDDDSTSAAWIRSITTLGAPLNGSLTANALGAALDEPSNVALGSTGWALTTLVHTLEFIDSAHVRRVFDCGVAPHWDAVTRSLTSLVRAAAWHSPIGDGRDNAAYDMSLHAAARRNVNAPAAYASTHYVSLVCDLDAADALASSSSSSPPRLACGLLLGAAFRRAIGAVAAASTFVTQHILPRRRGLQRRPVCTQTECESSTCMLSWWRRAIASLWPIQSAAFDDVASPVAARTTPSSTTSPTFNGDLLDKSPWYRALRWCARSVALPLLQAKRQCLGDSVGGARTTQATVTATALAGTQSLQSSQATTSSARADDNSGGHGGDTAAAAIAALLCAWQHDRGDGLCEVFSQSHPRIERAPDGSVRTVNVHPLPAPLAAAFERAFVAPTDAASLPPPLSSPPLAGVWHSLSLPSDHLDIVPFPRNRDVQRAFFTSYFHMLDALT